MSRKRSIIRAGAVLVVAVAAGHLVQTMNAGKETASKEVEQPKQVEQVAAGEPAAKLPEVPVAASLTAPTLPAPKAEEVVAAAEPAAGPEAAPVVELAALPEEVPPANLPKVEAPVDPVADAGAPAALPEPEQGVAPAATPPALADCTPAMTLAAAPQAMIRISLTAACNGGQRVVIRHGGLAVAESLDAEGKLELDLPALNTAGDVSVLFADASVARDALPMPEVEQTQRFAVQWMADDAFELHVLEGGATYGEPGHVWAEAPVSPNGGFVVTLGNPELDLPMMAQIYTWPADATVRVLPSVEAVVTEMSCARELLGETILSVAGTVTVKDLNLAMPECDALGDILVLNNLVPDVTLAAAN